MKMLVPNLPIRWIKFFNCPSADVLNQPNFKTMIKGNFLGAAIVAIIYTVYILWNPLPTKLEMVLALVILNSLTIVLMAFAFK